MRRHRVFALLVVLLFALALMAPASEVSEAGRLTRRQVTATSGRVLLEVGWLGPLELAFGWYANVPLLVCVSRMLRGRSPGFRVARAAACLAVSALLPFAAYSGQDGWHVGFLRGPAVWLWLLAFGLTFVYAHSATTFAQESR